jgi:hypothetical protein
VSIGLTPLVKDTFRDCVAGWSQLHPRNAGWIVPSAEVRLGVV